MLDEIYMTVEDKMEHAILHLESEFNTIPTGRAKTEMLDGVHVEAYGTSQPIKSVATVNTPDAQSILIKPFDTNVLGSIEKAILSANLGLTPGNDGKIIRINVPALTEERRKELVKVAHKMSEETKVAVRNVRRHANDEIKKMNKDKNLSDDEMSVALDEIQKYTDKFIKQVDDHLNKQEKALLTV